MGELVLKTDIELQAGTKLALIELIKEVREIESTYLTLFTQQKLADRMGKTVRTVYRYIDELVEKDVIEIATRRGRNGGSVAVINPHIVKFQSHFDNPFTGTTPTAKELRDKYYPNKGTYEPDNRTPEEKERDRIRAKRAQTRNDKMNAHLRMRAFPDKEFFNMAVEPEEVFKTYMISRAYNAVLITRIETWKNQAERDGDEESFRLAKNAYNRFRNYDVMAGEFMGTQTFQSFNQLRKLLDETGYDLMEYMHNAFDTTIYLLKQGKYAQPPFVNTLYGGLVLEKFEYQIKWKKDFEREHPYYAKPGDVNTYGHYYPITQIIGRAYKYPMEKSMDMQDIIDTHLDNLNNNAEDQLQKDYYETVVGKIKAGDYSEEAKRQTINFFNEKISTQLIPNMPEADYIVANLRKLIHGDDVDEAYEPNTREWYGQRGNFVQVNAETPLTNMTRVKRGYLVDFSINGGETFKYVWYAIENSSSYMWDIKKVQPVLEDLKELIPFTELGDVDLKQVVAKTLSPEAMDAQAKLEETFAKIRQEEDTKYLEDTLDTAPKMWYDVLESRIGSSLRDGQTVTEETLRR